MRLDLITPVLKLGPLDPVKVATGRSIEEMLRPHMVGPMSTELREEGPVQVYPCDLQQDLVNINTATVEELEQKWEDEHRSCCHSYV